jgi:hypothetical protein
MASSKWRQKAYQKVEFLPGEEFGDYRKRLEVERRKMRVTWAYEHPVRAMLSTLLAIWVGVMIVVSSAFLWWFVLPLLLPCVLFRQWRKMRRDRRHWKGAQNIVQLKRDGDDDVFRS